MSEQIVLDLHISADEYQHYYRGSIRTVVAQAVDGRTLRFPASILQSVVGHDGVRGRFAIEFSSDDGRFLGIKRL